MLSFFIGLLTFILVVNCLILGLLILVQLPKKDAGAGLAFGAGTAEAIFGAGSGTPLTKLTTYCSSIFLGLSLVLGILNAYHSRSGSRLIEQEAAKQAGTAPLSPEAEAPEKTAPAASSSPSAAPASAHEKPATPTATDGTSEPAAPSAKKATPTPPAKPSESPEKKATQAAIEPPELGNGTPGTKPLSPPQKTPITKPNPNN